MNKKQIEKLITKMKASQAGWKFEDCEKILLSTGYHLRSGKGSHFCYKRGTHTIIIARHNPVSKGAVQDVIKAYEVTEHE